LQEHCTRQASTSCLPVVSSYFALSFRSLHSGNCDGYWARTALGPCFSELVRWRNQISPARSKLDSRHLLAPVVAVLPDRSQKNEEHRNDHSHREEHGKREQSCEYFLQNVELCCEQKPNNPRNERNCNDNVRRPRYSAPQRPLDFLPNKAHSRVIHALAIVRLVGGKRYCQN
jgi:hypothetical protein